MRDGRRKREEVGCPRCGYDLRGTTTTWARSCPLEGRCTECGLVFEWAELLSPVLERPAWCVEFARRRRQVPLRSFRTLLMMARPWRFWSEIRMSHELRPGRILAFAVLLWALAYATFAVAQGTTVGRDLIQHAPKARARALFCAAYTVVLPFSKDPPAIYYERVMGWGGGVKYPPPPADYLTRYGERGVAWQPLRIALMLGRFDRWQLGTSFAVALVILGLAVVPLVTTPLAWVLLPVSRRRAKVRWAHLVRITLYSLAVVPIVAALTVARYAMLYRTGWGGEVRALYVELRHLALWGMPLLLTAWWYFATCRYLRMPHAAAVAVATVLIGVLIGPALIMIAWAMIR